jgi:hypothetical protein
MNTTLDTATATCTVFARWADLVAACRAGYVPSLAIVWETDEQAETARHIVRRALDRAGLAYWGCDRPVSPTVTVTPTDVHTGRDARETVRG